MSAASLALSPVISYPRVAEIGRTYLLTIDFQTPEGGAWAYPDEEFVVHCELDAAPLFSHRPVGDPIVVLHRFGGSYGPVSFLLTAAAQQDQGEIVVHFSSGQGLPLTSLTLPDITIKARSAAPGQVVSLPDVEPPVSPEEADESEVLGNLDADAFFAAETPDAPTPETVANAVPDAAPAEPLDRALANQLVQGLRRYWITTAEELIDVARARNTEHGSGLKALAVALEVPEPTIEAMVKAVAAAAPPMPRPENLTPLEEALGLDSRPLRPPVVAQEWSRPPRERPTKEKSPVVELPPAVTPPSIQPQQDQGNRNTVVAFALTAMYQILSGDNTDLSEQFLYWACKQRDGIPGDVGTDPVKAMTVFNEVGVCLEQTWPYNPTRLDDHKENPGQGPPPAGAVEEASLRRIGDSARLPGKGVVQIKDALATGWPVLLGLRVAEHWNTTSQGRTLGKRRPALPGERQSGGTAFCLFGYQDDQDAPGGGFFLAHGSERHIKICYKLVAEQGLTAIAAKGIAAHPGAAAGPDAAQAVAQQAEAFAAAWLDLRTGLPDAQPVPTNGLGRDGRPLLLIDDVAISRIAQGRPPVAPSGAQQEIRQQQATPATSPPPALDSREQSQLYKSKVQVESSASYGAVAGVDAQDLAQARWAVVVNALEDARLIQSVWPLIAHRMQQMGATPPAVEFRDGESAGAWHARYTDNGKLTLKDNWRAIPPVLLYRPGERVNAWLARNGVAQGPVDPRRGVPYYLLVLGRPGPLAENDETFIPPEFQRDLGVFWAVGRLCFGDERGAPDLPGYSAYAEARVRSERAAASTTPKLSSFKYVPNVAEDPLAESWLYQQLREARSRPNEPPDGNAGEGRSIAELLAFLGGGRQPRAKGAQAPASNAADWTPGLFVLAGHGLGLPFDDQGVLEEQGALVIDGAPGQVEELFVADDVRRDDLDGVALLLTSFAAGSPPYDTDLAGSGEGGIPLAPFAFIARLPQRLLRAGLGAVIAPYGRYWHALVSTRPTPNESGTQAVVALIGRLNQGRRVGDAFTSLAVNHARAAMELNEELESIKFGKQVDDAELARLWLAHRSLRNLMLLGDPAVVLGGDGGAM